VLTELAVCWLDFFDLVKLASPASWVSQQLLYVLGVVALFANSSDQPTSAAAAAAATKDWQIHNMKHMCSLDDKLT
jgi:hypothetical protein